MVEGVKAASTVYSIISPILDDEITSGKNKIKNIFLEKIHRRIIKKFCYSFFKEHNGTVLTNPVFSEFLQNDQTIERLFKYTGQVHVKQTDKEYLDSEMIRIEKDLEYPIDGADIKAIRAFLDGLLMKHRQYRESCLTADSKQIIQNDDRNTSAIIKSVESINEDTKKELMAAINAKGSLLVSQENDILKILNKSFWEGDFSLLESIQPVLHEKSESLDIWVNLVLNKALFNGDNYRTFYSFNDIKNPTIREDAVRKSLVFTYLCKNPVGSGDYNVSGELKELVERLSTGDEWLFTESKDVKNNVECYNITPFSGLKQENETIKILQVIKIFDRGVLGVANVIDSIIGSGDSNFVVELMSNARHYDESLIFCDSEVAAKKISLDVFNKLWNERHIYKITCKELQVIYWRILLQTCSVSANGRVNTYHKLLTYYFY